MAKTANPQLTETPEQTWERIEAAQEEATGAEEKPPKEAEAAEKKPAESTEEPAEAAEAKEDGEEQKEEPPKADAADITEEGQKLLELKKLAKELKMEVEGGKVSSDDFVRFRDWKRKQRAGIQQEKQTALAEIQRAREQAGQELALADQLKQIRESKNLEELVQLAGFEDWNDAIKHQAAVISDPSHKELQQLRDWQRKQEAAAEQQRRQAQTQAEQQQRQQQVNEYVAGLQHQMANSDEHVIRVMSRDPTFVQAVYMIQNQHWDGTTTVSPEQAARLAINQNAPTLVDEVRAKYKLMHEAFGQEQAEQMVREAKQDAQPKPAPKAPKSAPIPSGKTAEPSAAKRAWKTPQEFDRYAARLMREAESAERKSGG